jgi:hypothetical protein
LQHDTNSRTPCVALVTCAEFPALDSETNLLIEPLAALGITAAPAIWDDPNVDWSAFDLAVVRCCWDYHQRRGEFLAWADRVPRLANPADILGWNTDKRYLEELAGCGLPIVPTVWLQPDQQWTAPEQGEWVIKPSVSLASLDTGRYRMDDHEERRLASDQIRRLQHAGRTVMVQPYLAGVDTEGETSLVYFNGEFSHALRRGPILDGPDTGIDRRFQDDWEAELKCRQPDISQLALAERALAAVPRSKGFEVIDAKTQKSRGRSKETNLLYARVDLLPEPDGAPVLIELELTEPALFLGHAIGAADRFAAAIAARVFAGDLQTQRL